MNLNIALNTIIYIMVFLFPGVLFRKFYFLESNKSQFAQGHLLERFLLTILLSIFCLSTFFLFDFGVTYCFDASLVIDFGYDDFKGIFSKLSKNEIPANFDNKNTFLHFIATFAIIYLFSGFLGWLLYHIVKVLHLDNFLSVLRFNNEWDYLFTLPKRSVIKRKPLQRMKVQLDILTKCGDKETLYQGMYHNLIFNKDNEIDSIVLTSASKFIEISKEEDNKNKIEDIDESINRKEFLYFLYRDYKNKIIYKKHIQSHSFLISKKDIVNINLLYIKGSKIKTEIEERINKSKNVFYIYRLLNILKFLVPAIMFTLLFVDLKYLFLDTFWKKVYFFIITLGELYLILNMVMYWLRVYYVKEIKKSNLTGVLLAFMIALGTFYLNAFDIISIWLVIPAFLGIITIFSFITQNNSNTKD